MFASLPVLASCRYWSENLNSNQILLENEVYFFLGAFFVLEVHSETVTGNPGQHCGEPPFISSGKF